MNQCELLNHQVVNHTFTQEDGTLRVWRYCRTCERYIDHDTLPPRNTRAELTDSEMGE